MHIVRLTLISLLTTACSHFQNQPLIPTNTAAQLQTRSLNSPEINHFFAQSHYPKNQPWHLDKLTLAAYFYHPDLAIARAQAATADAAIITAGQRPNPSLNITPTWVSNLTSATPWIFVSALSIPIETAGKRGYRLDRSQHLSDAASLRLTETAWLIRTRLRLAMLEMFAAQENWRLLHQQHQQEQHIDQYLQQQRKAGELAETDLLASQLGLQQSQLALTAAEKRLADSKAVLAAAIGIPVAGLANTELDFSEFQHFPNAQQLAISPLENHALRERSDILASLADYAAAQSALQLEIANQYPNIQANPGYTFNTDEHRWSLGATALQLPLFNQNEGPIAEMAAKRQEAAQRFEALQLRIIGEIDRAYANALAIQPRRLAAGQLLANRQANLRSVQALLQAGETDAHAVAVAELELAVAEKNQLDVLVESQQSLAMLEAALRQPISPAVTAAMPAAAIKQVLP